MACRTEFIEFLCGQIANAGVVRYRMMFGDYVIYVDEKPVIIASDNTAYVKMHPAIEHLMKGADKGYPFPGAKEHYILDETDRHLSVEVVRTLAEVLPYPMKKKRKPKSPKTSTPD